VKSDRDVCVEGFPASAAGVEIALCRSRLIGAVQEFMKTSRCRDLRIVLQTGKELSSTAESSASSRLSQPSDDVFDDAALSARAAQYHARAPRTAFDFLVVSTTTMDALLDAVAMIELRDKIYGQWNLQSIQPYAGVALNFFGPPGTGKTLAAECLAARMGKAFLSATYAQIESKYHGDGPKNVDALFHAAGRDGALLFIDEADSLLSKRLTDVKQGSEQAINSMRSQLLLNLETFQGVAVFATNLVENYDKAFETRIRYVEFTRPDLQARRMIWRKHLPAELPLTKDVNADRLAAIEGLSGRDIRNAVLRAAARAARFGAEALSYEDFVASLSATPLTAVAVSA